MAPKETEDTEVLRRQRAKPSKEDRKKSAELRDLLVLEPAYMYSITIATITTSNWDWIQSVWWLRGVDWDGLDMWNVKKTWLDQMLYSDRGSRVGHWTDRMSEKDMARWCLWHEKLWSVLRRCTCLEQMEKKSTEQRVNSSSPGKRLKTVHVPATLCEYVTMCVCVCACSNLHNRHTESFYFITS